MQLSFSQTYLEDLFTEGKSTDKHHRFQPEVIRGYQKAIKLLQVANRIEDLYVFHSLHFEALHGDKEGLFSVRANGQYRVEFEIIEDKNEIQVHVCNILELSNHYQ